MAENDVMFSIFSEDELIEKYHESRKANLKLLEQRRELLLELQRVKSERQADENLSQKCEQLQRKVDELERKSAEMSQSKEDIKNPPSQTNLPGNEASGIDDCKCSCAEKLKDTIKVNHQWNDAYKRSVFRIHEAEKKARRLEDELKVEVTENSRLIELVNKLESDLRDPKQNGYIRINSLEEVCNKDDIEALKLQMLTFQDDFNKEKDDKQKSVKESERLQAQLDESKRVIQSLSDSIALYKQQILKLSQNQDHLHKQIKALIDDRDYTYRPMERQLSQRHSFPLSLEDYSPRQSNAATRRPETDMFSGGRVVRDS